MHRLARMELIASKICFFPLRESVAIFTVSRKAAPASFSTFGPIRRHCGARCCGQLGRYR